MTDPSQFTSRGALVMLDMPETASDYCNHPDYGGYRPSLVKNSSGTARHLARRQMVARHRYQLT